MKRSHALGLLLLALASAPAAVLAQDDTDDPTENANTSGGISVVLREVGGEPYRSSRETPLGKAACDDNVTLSFRLTGLQTGPDAPQFLWVLVGTACNTEARRDGQGTDDCVEVDTIDLEQNKAQLDVPIEIAALCELTGDAPVYFLPVDVVPTPEAISIYGTYEVDLDVTPPSAPRNLKGGVGETEIPIEWDQGGGNPINFWLVWDTEPTEGAAGSGDTNTAADGGADAGSSSSAGAGGSGGASGSGGDAGSDTGDSTAECGSDKLVPNTPFDVDSLPPGIRRKRIEGEVTRATLSGSEIGGQKAAVAVIAEDLAGNQSVLSDFACIEVVETDGFWDEYKNGGGAAESGCACSVPSASRSPLSALPVVLALLLLRVRRKRRS